MSKRERRLTKRERKVARDNVRQNVQPREVDAVGVNATTVLEGALRALIRARLMPLTFKAVVLLNTRSQAESLAACRFHVFSNVEENEIVVGTPEALASEHNVVETRFENDDDFFPRMIEELKAEGRDLPLSQLRDLDRFLVIRPNVIGFFRADYSNGMSSLSYVSFPDPEDGQVPDAVAERVVQRAKDAETATGKLVRVVVSATQRVIYGTPKEEEPPPTRAEDPRDKMN